MNRPRATAPAGRRAAILLAVAMAVAGSPACSGDPQAASGQPAAGPVATATPAAAKGPAPVPGTAPSGPSPGTTMPDPRSRRPDQLVTLYGAPGTFGALDRGHLSALSTAVTAVGPRGPIAGARPIAVGIDNFRFEPGASAAFTAVTDHGRVVIGTFPQSNNQVVPTMTSMSVAVVDPVATSFASVLVPTTAGTTDVGTGTPAVGGADVSDVCTMATADGVRTVGVSAMPYKNWAPALGVFPSVATFVDDGGPGAGAVRFEAASSRSVAQLATTDAGRRAVAMPAYTDHDLDLSSQGLNECDVTPGGDLIVTQYLPAAGRTGGVTILDRDLRVVASHAGPEVALAADLDVTGIFGRVTRVPAGTPVILSAREVHTDPSRTDPRDQRFVVVYDVHARAPRGGGLGGDLPVDVGPPQVFEEFRYNAVTRAVASTTGLLMLRDEAPAGAPNSIVRAETVVYAPDGTLFVARTHADSARSAPMAVFGPGRLASRPSVPAPLGRFVEPDRSLTAFDAGPEVSPLLTEHFASIFALAYDPVHDLVLGVSMNGVLRAVPWNGTGAAGAACQVDLGGPALGAAHAPDIYESRQGAIDARRGVWYVPFQGMTPISAGRIGATIPQFLWAVDLERLAAACRP